MKDLVTVFTPVYNRKNLIGNLYQSLLSQTYKNFEWIIVDDGSTDDIDEIIKSYQNGSNPKFWIYAIIRTFMNFLNFASSC